MILTLAAWASESLNRRLFGEPLAIASFWPRVSGTIGAGFGLLFLGGLAAIMPTVKDQDILEGRLGVLPVLLALALVITLITPAVALFAARGFGADLRARLAQGWFALLTLSLLVVLWFAWTWNLHIFAR
jgi:hypothetical protein